MGKTTTLNCDSCSKDLSTTQYAAEYYLVLGTGRKSNPSGFSYAYAISPPIKETHYFCGLGCLDAWRASVKKEDADD